MSAKIFGGADELKKTAHGYQIRWFLPDKSRIIWFTGTPREEIYFKLIFDILHPPVWKSMLTCLVLKWIMGGVGGGECRCDKLWLENLDYIKRLWWMIDGSATQFVQRCLQFLFIFVNDISTRHDVKPNITFAICFKTNLNFWATLYLHSALFLSHLYSNYS